MSIRRFQSTEELAGYRALTTGLKNAPKAESELVAHLPLYFDRSVLGHILFMDELYRLILGVHGIVVFGTRWGRNLALLTQLRNLYEPRNASRRIVGFDTFEGFPDVRKEDGQASGVAIGSYSVTPGYDSELATLLAAHEKFGFRSRPATSSSIEAAESCCIRTPSPHGFDRIASSARLPMPLHDLRHGFATALLAQGGHPAIASAVPGHSSPAFTKATYQHVLSGMDDVPAPTVKPALSREGSS